MKKYIIIIIVLVLYLGIMFFAFFSKEDDKNKNDEEYYIVFSNNIWKHSSGRFVTERNKESAFSKKYNIYINNQFFGKYNLGSYENDIYLFDDDNNSIDYDGQIFGSTRNDLKVYQLDEQEITNDDLANATKALNKLNVKEEIKKQDLIKYSLDIDNDGIIENIYSLSNMFDETKTGKGYSLVFIEKDNKINILTSDVKSNKNSFGKGYEYYINNIADIDGDEKVDFIISKSDYGSPEICYLLIQKQEKEYRVTKNC